MYGEVLVPLLKAVVFADVMQVVTSDDNSPLHLHFSDHTYQNRQTQTYYKKALNTITSFDQCTFQFVTRLHQ